MANISLKTMTFEGLDNTYKIPQNLDDLDGKLDADRIEGLLPSGIAVQAEAPDSDKATLWVDTTDNTSGGGLDVDRIVVQAEAPDSDEATLWIDITDESSEVLTDPTLTEAGVPADAKAVGDALRDITVDVETDPTLSIADKPADAKATGDAISEAVEDLNSAISSNANNIALQTARIDGIVALPEGSTTGDAELADARIGTYAQSYSTLGNAIRKQIDALNDTNCVDIVKSCASRGASSNAGISFDMDKNGAITTFSFSGTSTAASGSYSICNILGSISTLKGYFRLNQKYRFQVSDLPTNAYVCLTQYTGSSQAVSQKFYTQDFDFTLSRSDLTGCMISMRVAGGKSANGTAKIRCLTSHTNDELYNELNQGLQNNIANDKDSRAIIEDSKKALTQFIPLQNVAGTSGSQTFQQGQTYNGIPYSNKMDKERTVLFNLSLESVFTQFKNPYSEIYKFNPSTESDSASKRVWCGAVCSTWVSWATNRPFNMVVDEIERYLVWKMRYDATLGEYIKECDTGDLEVGDIMWQEGHVAVISGFQVGLNGVERVLVTEMWKPTFRADWYNVDDFWRRIETGYYPTDPSVPHTPFSIGRFSDDYKIRTLPRLHLVDDIITNKGDNVYFAIGEDVWTYITDSNHTLTITKPDGTTTTVDYTTLPQQSTNSVYNLKSVLTDAGLYRIKGAHSTYASRITMYNAPNAVTASKADNTITVNIGTHEGLKLVGFMMITLNKTGNGSYLIPEQAAAQGYNGANAPTYKVYHDALAENTTDFEIVNAHLPDACYIRIYYETGCGLTYKDSNVILPE